MSPDQLLAQLRESLKGLRSFQRRTHGPAVTEDHVELDEAQWGEAIQLYARLAYISLSGLVDAGLVDEFQMESLEDILMDLGKPE